jgi:hypothetical protein
VVDVITLAKRWINLSILKKLSPFLSVGDKKKTLVSTEK